MLAFGAEGVLDALIRIADVGLRIETGQRAEVRAAIGVVEEVIQLAPVALQDEFRSRSRLVGSRGVEQVEEIVARIDGGAVCPLQGCHPMLVQLETAIDAADSIEEPIYFFVGVENSNRRLASDIA